ncbi:MAG: hypothetical protein ACUVTM_01715 [Candidatus Bathyarchaeia archaeon]
MEIWIPYGETEVRVGVRAENLVGLAQPEEPHPNMNPRIAIAEAVSKIHGAHPLEKLLGQDDNVALTVDLPPNNKSFELIDLLLFELSNLVNIDKVSVLWIQNDGWPPVQKGLRSEVEDFKILNCCVAESPHQYKGVGNSLKICKEFAEADLRILVGRVGFDPVWGYTGGVKTILSLLDNRTRTELCRKVVLTQIDNGPGRLDAVEELESILPSDGLTVMLSIVENIDGGVARIFSGTFEESFGLGAKFLNEHYSIELDRAVDILIVGAGGRPYDYTLFSSLDSAFMNMGVLKKGSVLILAAECMGGYGSEGFRNYMLKGGDPEQMRSMFRRGFEIGAEKAYLLAKLLEEFRVYLVSVMPDYYVKKVFRLRSSKTVNDALSHALKILGKDSEVAVAPYGSLTQTLIKSRV